MLIHACSTNPGKLKEFVLAAHAAGAVLEPLPNLAQIVSPEESGETFEANATLKAIYYSGFSSEIVLADDSGLCVDALNGAPGVQSARYAGCDAGAAENNALLIERMAGVQDRSAHFVCVIALARKGKLTHIARGTVDGQILFSPSGNNGFGYDPLFLYPPIGRSFGELSDDEKLAVSARGRALRQAFTCLSAAGKQR
ncbi:MAG: RdgB/HAM1 family non-canonical purine NTP pyrophosphatase [Acidobacteriaceae bacterium]|nr:RdgB/HAM1 family non-canonical purine NTP pyrophosphatase [Acidobacteriaceae bacterium]